MLTTFHLPTKIIFGTGSLDQVGTEAARLGQKAILVVDPNVRKIGVLSRVVQALDACGVDTLVFDRVVPNPRSSIIDEGAGIIRQENVKVVVGIGGGSAMDTAKGMALVGNSSKSIWDFMLDEIPIEWSVLPLILVPTTAATGSEADNIAVFTHPETREKRSLFSQHMFPRVSIVDPELTLSVPKRQTALGGIDIFLHTMEGYITTPEISFITDGIAEAIMRTAVVFLPKVLDKPDDIEARTQLSWASPLAISQVKALGGGAGVPTLHLIAVPLSGYYDIAHAEGLVALLSAWMRYTVPARPDRFRSLGENVFGEADGVAAVERWLDKVGMRLRLRDLNVDPRCFEEIAKLAIKQDRLKAHPRLLDLETVKRIYQESY